MKHSWGICGAILGSWELLALTTGRVPTISLTVHQARVRWPTFTDAIVLTWAAGTVRHLFTYQP